MSPHYPIMNADPATIMVSAWVSPKDWGLMLMCSTYYRRELIRRKRRVE